MADFDDGDYFAEDDYEICEDDGDDAGLDAEGRLRQLEPVEGEENEDEGVDDDIGCEVTPFNLNEERKEGKFDSSGFFVPSKDTERQERRRKRHGQQRKRDAKQEIIPDVYHSEESEESDEWMDGECEEICKELGKNREVANRLEKDWSEKEKQEAAEAAAAEEERKQTLADGKGMAEKLRKLADLVGEVKGKTVSGALAAAGKNKDKEMVKEIGDISDDLCMLGMTDIYEMTEMELFDEADKREAEDKPMVPTKQAPKKEADIPVPPQKKAKTLLDELDDDEDEENGNDNKESSDANVKWEYSCDGGKTIQGPFTGMQMEQWHKMGFFVGDKRADVRKVGSTHFVSSETISSFI